jgi:hypothetical protein
MACNEGAYVSKATASTTGDLGIRRIAVEEGNFTGGVPCQSYKDRNGAISPARPAARSSLVSISVRIHRGRW